MITEYVTVLNEQTAKWLLFLGGFAAAFASQVAKFWHCSYARCPGSQSGMARRNTKIRAGGLFKPTTASLILVLKMNALHLVMAYHSEVSLLFNHPLPFFFLQTSDTQQPTFFDSIHLSCDILFKCSWLPLASPLLPCVNSVVIVIIIPSGRFHRLCGVVEHQIPQTTAMGQTARAALMQRMRPMRLTLIQIWWILTPMLKKGMRQT